MKNTRELAEWILREIRLVNPYTGDHKLMAFIWATGFLARCCAEMIWRDNRNLEIFRQILEQRLPK